MALRETFSPFQLAKPRITHLMDNVPGQSLFPSGAWAHLRASLRLSPREMQIIQGVFDDRNEDDIAFELDISPHTVNTYFRRIYTKLHVSSRQQLIIRVIAEYLSLLASNNPPPVSFN